MDDVDSLYNQYKTKYIGVNYPKRREQFAPIIEQMEASFDPASKNKAVDALSLIKDQVVDSLRKYKLPVTAENVNELIKREVIAPSNPYINAAQRLMRKYSDTIIEDVDYDYYVPWIEKELNK